MAEYIDKEDAVGVIADWAEDRRMRTDSDHGQIIQRCISLIRDLPPADVTGRPHGTWDFKISPTRHHITYPHCSVCGCPQFERSPFCPNCGADMSETEDSEATLRIVDKDHIWLNGKQFVSLARVGEMIKEDRLKNIADSINAITVEWDRIKNG